jgi:hypothetical protein
VDHSDASGNSQRFHNLDIVVFRPCSTLWRYIFIRGNIRSQQRRLISQGAVCCEEGAAGC